MPSQYGGISIFRVAGGGKKAKRLSQTHSQGQVLGPNPRICLLVVGTGNMLAQACFTGGRVDFQS